MDRKNGKFFILDGSFNRSGTIKTVFPESFTQICVVHQILNSCKYVVWKDMKEFTKDIKEIYISINKEQASISLEHFDQKWGSKYFYAVQSWHRNWEDLTVFFDFPVEIRKYTKYIYLAISEIEKKWTQPIIRWRIIMN